MALSLLDPVTTLVELDWTDLHTGPAAGEAHRYDVRAMLAGATEDATVSLRLYNATTAAECCENIELGGDNRVRDLEWGLTVINPWKLQALASAEDAVKVRVMTTKALEADLA